MFKVKKKKSWKKKQTNKQEPKTVSSGSKKSFFKHEKEILQNEIEKHRLGNMNKMLRIQWKHLTSVQIQFWKENEIRELFEK